MYVIWAVILLSGIFLASYESILCLYCCSLPFVLIAAWLAGSVVSQHVVFVTGSSKTLDNCEQDYE